MTSPEPEGTDSGAAPFAFEVTEHEGGAVVAIRGDLEFGTVAPLRLALVELLQHGADPVVLDVAGLEFIDSTGLSVLVQAKQRLEAEGRRFALRNPPPRVLRVLETSGMADLFVIERA